MQSWRKLWRADGWENWSNGKRRFPNFLTDDPLTYIVCSYIWNLKRVFSRPRYDASFYLVIQIPFIHLWKCRMGIWVIRKRKTYLRASLERVEKLAWVVRESTKWEWREYQNLAKLLTLGSCPRIKVLENEWGLCDLFAINRGEPTKTA